MTTATRLPVHVSAPSRLASVRAWVKPRLDRLIAGQNTPAHRKGGCGATLTPGQEVSR
ncbi:hypothetical protein [Streptomyces antnestii]|uniref:hypothetical protein n=1 Tax=Streptomyces antnestii TaxID=2494256 RepID=UPI00167804A6|nr:hypothetical protein [Streptomyces sp. San01]